MNNSKKVKKKKVLQKPRNSFDTFYYFEERRSDLDLRSLNYRLGKKKIKEEKKKEKRKKKKKARL